MTSEQIQLGSQSNNIIPCAHCSAEINSGDAYIFKGEDKAEVYICKDCIKDINNEYENETNDPNFIGALGLGIIGGAVGALLWYFIVVLTKMQIGYMAIGLGYLIGFAVYFGSGKKRGLLLQLLAVGLTLASLIIAEVFIFNHFVFKEVDKAVVAQEGLTELTFIIEGLTGKYSSVFLSGFFKNLFSPIGLLIYGIGLYVAFGVPKPRKI